MTKLQNALLAAALAVIMFTGYKVHKNSQNQTQYFNQQSMRPNGIYVVNLATNWHSFVPITNSTMSTNIVYPHTNNCILNGGVYAQLFMVMAHNGRQYNLCVETNLLYLTNGYGRIVYNSPSNAFFIQ